MIASHAPPSAMSATRLGGRVAELLERAGPKPAGGGGGSGQQGRHYETLGFWAGCLLPLGPGEQQALLAMTNSGERLRCGCNPPNYASRMRITIVSFTTRNSRASIPRRGAGRDRLRAAAAAWLLHFELEDLGPMSLIFCWPRPTLRVTAARNGCAAHDAGGGHLRC